MRYRNLGATDLTVSAIGFGAWAVGGNQWGPTDDRESIDAIRKAFDLGVTFFDTADVYGFGHSEKLCGKALANNRDKVVIATKGGLRWDASGNVWRDTSAKYITEAVEASLRRLNTDVIDLYHIHWPDPKTPAEESMGALDDLVAQGKIRYVGVSNYSLGELQDAATFRRVDSVQPMYHLFDHRADKDLLPYCAKNNIGVVIYGPMAHGLLAGRINKNTTFAEDDWRAASPMFTSEGLARNVQVVDALAEISSGLNKKPNELAIAWTLMNPAVHVAIVGAKSARQVESNVQGDFVIPPDGMKRIDELFKSNQWSDVPFPKP